MSSHDAEHKLERFVIILALTVWMDKIILLRGIRNSISSYHNASYM